MYSRNDAEQVVVSNGEVLSSSNTEVVLGIPGIRKSDCRISSVYDDTNKLIVTRPEGRCEITADGEVTIYLTYGDVMFPPGSQYYVTWIDPRRG